MPQSLRSGFVNHLVVYTLVGFGLSGSIGLGTVWMQHQISAEARLDHDLEQQIDTVQRKSEELTTEIAREQDPDALRALDARWRLGLVPPSEDRIQPVAGDPVQRLMSKDNQELFRIGLPGAAPRYRAD